MWRLQALRRGGEPCRLLPQLGGEAAAEEDDLSLVTARPPASELSPCQLQVPSTEGAHRRCQTPRLDISIGVPERAALKSQFSRGKSGRRTPKLRRRCQTPSIGPFDRLRSAA